MGLIKTDKHKMTETPKSKEMISKEAICMIPCFKEAKEDYLVKLGDVIIAIDWTIEEAITSTRASFRELVQGIFRNPEDRERFAEKYKNKSIGRSEIRESADLIAPFVLKEILASLDLDGLEVKEDG